MVETKVKASTSVAAISGMILWLLGRYIFRGSVPDVVASWTYVLVPGVLTFAAGYFARHTHRPDLPPAPVALPAILTWNNPAPLPVPAVEEAGPPVPPV